MNIDKVIEHKKVADYIFKHNLLVQYKKAKNYLLQGFYLPIKFKLREPKSKGIYQFRINKKYRVFGYIENNTFFVAKISDHQD